MPHWLVALTWAEVTVLLGLCAAAARYAKPFIGWATSWLGHVQTRRATLEQEIALLRVAFDKSRRRENGYATVCELLILGLEVAPEERPLFIRRAREVLEATLRRE